MKLGKNSLIDIFYGEDPQWEQGFRKSVITLLRYVVIIYKEMIQDRCFIRSGALSFTTFLTLLPLMILSILMFHASGNLDIFRQKFETALFNHLLPESVASVRNYLKDMISNFDIGTISVISIAFFLITAYLMFAAVDSSLNAVWGINVRRSILSRLVHLWFFLTIIPILIGYSLFLSAKFLDYEPGTGSMWLEIRQHVIWSYPILITWISLAILYKFVPSTKVHWDSALFGAFLSAVFWEISKYGFNYYVKNFASLQMLYGSFLVLPLFLIWINLTWLIILAGAECSYTFQNMSDLHHRMKFLRFRKKSDLAFSPQLGFSILLLVFKAFRSGAGPLRIKQIAHQVPIPLNVTLAHIERLKESGFIVMDSESEFLSPAMDDSKIEVIKVWKAFESEEFLKSSEEMQRVWEYFQSCVTHVMDDTSLANLIHQEQHPRKII